VASPASAQLPAPWTSRDIGSPAVAGSATESSGTFTVRGAGTDIGSTSDQFHFVSQPVSGDIDVRALIFSIQNVDQSTKAGVMIRETLSGSSRHASTFVMRTQGLAFQRRLTEGAETLHTSGGQAKAPYWVRLVRAGQQFSSYVSVDGTSWQLIGTETIAMAASVQVGLAVTSHDARRTATATFTNVTVNPAASAPSTSPWANGDIGSPTLAGSSRESNGTFFVTGAGSGIWAARDQFQFMYQPAVGDVEIIACLNDAGGQRSKAGVMIRDSLSASAANAFMMGTPNKGWSFQRRPVTGGSTVNSPGSFTPPPGWVRLVRSGDLFTAYESTNGIDWVIVGTETIPMPAAVYVGLAVTSQNKAATTTAIFTNVSIKGQTSPTNVPPTVTLLAPADGTAYPAPAAVALSASASDSDGTITRVDFYANGRIVATDTASPFSGTWSSVPAGTYRLSAVGTDDKGATATSATTTITVSAPLNQPPTVSIASPANGATYTAPATISIAANAADVDGTIVRVEFYAGSQLIGTDTSAPYTTTATGVAAGTYALTAVATDEDNAVTASAAVNVTVSAPPNQPPTVAITSPANGATYSASPSIAINATATDRDGSVTRVDFFANGQAIGTDSTSPFTLTWSGVAAGTYSLTAVARDNASATATSATVTVSVSAMPAPWANGDVGNPALSGTSSSASGTFTVTGAGVDVWGTADQFQFAYQRLQGDIDIVARVGSLQGPNSWSKAGVMIRGTLSADAPNVFVAATIANGWTFQQRRAAGDISYAIPSRPAGTAPGWVRLVRMGNEFRGYYSPDGTTWTLLGTDTITMSSTVYVGLAVTSHESTSTGNGTFSDVRVGAPTGVPNQAPTVSIMSPANGATFTAPASLVIAASAADVDGTVARVDFFANGQQIGTETTSPFSMPWSNIPAGTYSITAVARDDDGASTTSATSTVTVGAAPAPAPTTPTPTGVVFAPSPDHDTLVISYSVAIYRATDPVTATAIATKNVGKPAPTNGEITVDVSDAVNPLASGSYYVVVIAVGSAGTAASGPSETFTK
jgi:regulation of enolase protein 1 (concanavalin A-like superfamily)